MEVPYMLGQIAPALLAALIAMLLGGSLRGLAAQPIAGWPLALAALVLELVLSHVSTIDQPWLLVWGHWLWVGTTATVLLVLLANIRHGGVHRGRRPDLAWVLASLGVALNLSVILANGGYMPVSESALEETGQAAHLAARPRYRRDVPITPETHLAALADVLPLPGWMPQRTVNSVGDVILAAGLAAWAFQAAYAARRLPVGRAQLSETAH
jgi:hypothetical protein